VNFIVLAQAPCIAEPSERSLDQPAPRQHFEPPGSAAADNRQGPLEHLPDPIDQRATVGGIGKDYLDTMGDGRKAQQ